VVDSSGAGEDITMHCFKEDFEPYIPINVREFLQQLSNSVFPRRTPPLEVNRLQIEPPETSVNLFTCNSIHVLNNGPMYKHFIFVLRKCQEYQFRN
jgi:hypothetical protein